MKWKMADSPRKADIVANRSTYRINTARFLSALVRYSMKRRKLENRRSRPLSPISTNTNSCAVHHHQAKRMRSSITKEELSAIQTQLAILSDGDGDRPIHIAAANEDTKLVQKLCLLMAKNSISLDITNYLRQTPLHLAVMVGNAEIIKLLFSFGASLLVFDRNGNSALHLAVKSSSNQEVFHVLLSHAQAKNILNSMDYEGYSPLHYAVFKKNSDAVRILHSYEADMNKIDGKSGRTALIHAVLEQNSDMVELLLECGACPQKVDYSGRSAVEMALQVSNMHIVKLLEKKMPQNEVTGVKEQIIKSTLRQSAKSKRTKSRK